MVSFRSYVVACNLLLLTAPTALAANCNGVIGAVAAAVAQYPEAQSFCSTKFPQAAPTTTVTGPASTVTITSAGSVTTTNIITVSVTSATQTNTVTASTAVVSVAGSAVSRP